ncbi:MAG: FAD:protein FMN transferase [Lachnospiraceae bacterium]|nr:FAD:protein FMN transferase [Lachnospiraceae bacterium]
MKRFRIKLFTTLSVIISIATIVCGCGRQTLPVTKTGFAFDTIISVSLYGENAENVANELMIEATRLDNLWNKNKSTSDIYKINNSSGNPVEVSPETFFLINEAVRFAKESNGAFDPTIGSVTSLWDFKSEEPFIPDEKDIEDALSSVNYKYILFSENGDNAITITNPKSKIDVGAIAKGYAGDILAKYCYDSGIESGFINLGGNVIVLGPKPGSNEPINVGIKNPVPESNDISPYTSIPMYKGCVVTSGLYERGFKYDGKYYHHILNTKTGYPVKNNLLSVSVIGPSSITCDALSTILFINGIDDGLEFIKNYPEYKIIFIDDELISTISN